MSQLSDLKSQIRERLVELKNDGILGEVVYDDYKMGIFDRDFAAFPAAILTVPSVANDSLTNTQNIRTYTYQIVVVMKAEDVTSPEQVEDLIMQILDKFDNQITMQNTADGGVEPSSTSPEAATSRGKSFIAFAVNIKAKVVKDLSFE